MLINATRTTEVRAAILDDGKLEQFEIEVEDAALLKGNIYRGVIANVEPSLNACFVDIGTEKHGFLPFDEIAASAYHEKGSRGDEKPRVEDVMRRKREVIVQVVKDSQGNKGPALTTYTSIAGRYIVLMPQDDSRGVSRKVDNDAQRKKIKEIASGLKIPEQYGFIVRTAGLDRTKAELNRDAAALVRTWKDIEKGARKEKSTALLYEDRDLVVRMLRDYHSADITQILVDTEVAYARAFDYFRMVMPRGRQVLELYDDKTPLFARHGVEEQVDTIFSRRVELPSGGYVLIDPTEALTAIDVNSGKSNKHKSQEETAYHTNLEAAAEVARQLRLRDLGGLVVIDFIDMAQPKQNRAVEKALKDALRADKARTYVGRISDNGLLELNRQRIRQSLQHQTHRACPTCEGRGSIPSPDFVALNMMRKIESRAATGLVDKVVVSLHPELADHLQNLHRQDLVEIERRFAVLVAIESRPGMHRNEQDVRWIAAAELPEAERRALVARKEAMRAAERERRLAPKRVQLLQEGLDEIAEDELEANGTVVTGEEPVVIEAEEYDAEAIEDGQDEREGDGESGASAAPPAPRRSRADASPSSEEGEGGRRRRRRRRRRGRGRDGEGADGTPPGAEGQSAAEGESADEGAGEDGEGAEAPIEAEGESESSEGTEGAPPADAAGAAAEGDGRRRRRRRRRRGRRGAEGPGEGAGTEAAADGTAEDDGEGEQRPTDADAPAPIADDVADAIVEAEPPIQGEPPGEQLVPPPEDSMFGSG